MGVEGGEHGPDRCRAGDGGAGDGQDLTFGLAGAAEAPYRSSAQGSQTVQIPILGTVFWIIGAIWDLAFASASGAIGTWLKRRPRVQAAQPRLEGLAYLGLAGWAAITGSRPGH